MLEQFTFVTVGNRFRPKALKGCWKVCHWLCQCLNLVEN